MDSIQKASPKPSDLMEVFFSYAHEDEVLRDELAKHLKLLERQGVIKAWSDRNITAGEEWKNAIDERLESANIILLLISADFLASDYCYDIELDRALERHKSKAARVIPIILRSSDWQSSSFGKLAALPTGGKAITSWPNEDEAFTDVVKGLRKAIEQIQGVSFPNPQDSTNKNGDFETVQKKKKVQIFGAVIAFLAGLISLIPLLSQKLQKQPSSITEVLTIGSPSEVFIKPPSILQTPKKSPIPKISTPASSSKAFVPVIIEYDGNKNQKKKVEELSSDLKDRKFESYTEDLSKREDRNKFKDLEKTEIRYYRDQDKEQAEDLKGFLKSININAIIPNKSAGTNKQIEIWLSPNTL
jgi:TIR domain